jgi:hypothetical protein
LLAAGADRQQAAQGLHVGQGGLQFASEFLPLLLRPDAFEGARRMVGQGLQ